MALHSSLHTGSGARQVTNAQDARLAMGGQMALNGPGPLDVRTGIVYAPGSLGVTGDSSTSPWRYTVPVNTYVTSKGAMDGPHLMANDGAVLVSTIVPPGSNSRYDLIYVMQNDQDATISPDGATAPLIGVVNGTAGASPSVPALPAGAIALATALVASTATTGTSGAGVTIDNTVSRFTSVRGGHITVRNATERAELTVRDGLQVYRLDLHCVETYNAGTSAWVLGDDTGWLGLTAIGTSWNAPVGGNAVTVRRIGNRGTLRGLQRANTATIGPQAATVGLGTLPAGMFPPNGFSAWAVGWISGGTDITVEVNITSAGVVACAVLATITGIRFDGLTWLTD